MVIGQKTSRTARRQASQSRRHRKAHRAAAMLHFRVENGHTIPVIETLEKYARALEIPLYKLFYEGEEPLTKPKLPFVDKATLQWGTSGEEWLVLRRFAKSLRRMNERERIVLLGMAQRMARRHDAK